MERKLAKWYFHTLNILGHLVMLKSILQVMPLYLFSALAPSKHILKYFCNLWGTFLWGGTNKTRKWTLIGQNTLFHPKLSRGLGLHDPKTLSLFLGAKTWWRWLNINDDLWSWLWHRKYCAHTITHNLIRLNGHIPWYLIWNATWNNRHLIQQYCF